MTSTLAALGKVIVVLKAVETIDFNLDGRWLVRYFLGFNVQPRGQDCLRCNHIIIQNGSVLFRTFDTAANVRLSL